MSLEAPGSAVGARQSSDNEHRALAQEVVLLKTLANTIAGSSPQHALDDVDRALILLEQVASHARVEHEFRFRLAHRDHRPCATGSDRVEADRLTQCLAALRASLARGEVETAREEIRCLLYELQALTRLHFADELVDTARGRSSIDIDERPGLLATI